MLESSRVKVLSEKWKIDQNNRSKKILNKTHMSAYVIPNSVRNLC